MLNILHDIQQRQLRLMELRKEASRIMDSIHAEEVLIAMNIAQCITVRESEVK